MGVFAKEMELVYCLFFMIVCISLKCMTKLFRDFGMRSSNYSAYSTTLQALYALLSLNTMRQKMNEVSFELDLSRYFQVQSSPEQKIILSNKRLKKI